MNCLILKYIFTHLEDITYSFLLFFATVKLEVQLRHRLPPSLERSGKGGGRR